MKNLFVLLLMIFMVSCLTPAQKSHIEKNEKATIDWINEHEKPIIVTKGRKNEFTYYYNATLVDKNSVMYSSGDILMALPDTIKPPVEEKKSGYSWDY